MYIEIKDRYCAKGDKKK